MSPRDPPETPRPDASAPQAPDEKDLPNVLEESDTPDEHEGAAIFEHESAPVASDMIGIRIEPDEETEDVVNLIDKLDPRLNREEPPV